MSPPISRVSCRERLVPTGFRTPVAVVGAVAAVLLMVMSVRYAGGTRASWIDGVLAQRLEPVGDEHEWSLERIVDLGDPVPAALLVVVLALVALRARGVPGLVLATVAPTIAVLFGHLILKPLIERTDEDGLVFPSTHAALVTALAAVAALLLAGGPRRRRRALRGVTAAVALVVATSGMVAALTAADYHYFTDGVGGVLLALAVVAATALGLDAHLSSRPEGRSRTGLHGHVPPVHDPSPGRAA